MNEAGQGDDEGLGAELDAALEVIKTTRDLPFVERFKLLGLDPKTNFAGGDWRNCDFSKSDLRGADFRNSRLFYANFKHALVDGTDFRGAGDVHTAKIHLSIGWRDAQFDDYQIILIQAQREKMLAYFESQDPLRREVMTDKEWFFAIKACPSFSEANLVLEQMETAGHLLNPFAYSYVLDRAKRDHKVEAGWTLLKRFLDAGGKPDEALYTAGIGVAPDGARALDLFDTMKIALANQGSAPDERAYNMTISKQGGNFNVALGLFHDMKRKQVRVSRHTIYALFDACRDFPNAVTVLMEARKAGVDINDSSFVDELSNTGRYSELNNSNIRFWKAEGLSHSDIIGRLIIQILRDPFRRDALEALGLLNGSSSKPL